MSTQRESTESHEENAAPGTSHAMPGTFESSADFAGKNEQHH